MTSKKPLSLDNDGQWLYGEPATEHDELVAEAFALLEEKIRNSRLLTVPYASECEVVVSRMDVTAADEVSICLEISAHFNGIGRLCDACDGGEHPTVTKPDSKKSSERRQLIELIEMLRQCDE